MPLIILYILSFSFTSIFANSPLELSISASPARINPLLATDSASAEISDRLFNGLVKFDTNGSITGDLAKSFSFEDNRTLIFTLHSGIKWHDGVEMTSDDVVYTYNLLQSPKLVTPYKDDFRYVKSVEAIGKYGIKVVYKEPYFKALSIWMMGILPKHLWEREDNPMTSKLNKNPIGTGAYMLKKAFKVNEKIVLEANPHYFIHPPHIKKINYHYISDHSTQFITLKAKELDIGSLTPIELNRQIDSGFHSHYQIVEQPSQSYTYIGFNLRLDKFKDKRVREAISYAIDKEELIDLLFFSHGKVCHGPFMPDSSVYPKEYKPKGYDINRSKELLAELGYSSSNPLEFELISSTGNDTRINASVIIQHQLAKAGIKMSIRIMEWQAFLNSVVMPHKF